MTGRQKLVLALLLGAQFMIAVDFSILNVALPAVGEGLGFALTNLQWIATAFALAASGFTLLYVEERIGGSHRPLDEVSPEIREALYNEALQQRFQDWLSRDLRERHHVEVLN